MADWQYHSMRFRGVPADVQEAIAAHGDVVDADFIRIDEAERDLDGITAVTYYGRWGLDFNLARGVSLLLPTVLVSVYWYMPCDTDDEGLVTFQNGRIVAFHVFDVGYRVTWKIEDSLAIESLSWKYADGSRQDWLLVWAEPYDPNSGQDTLFHPFDGSTCQDFPAPTPPVRASRKVCDLINSLTPCARRATDSTLETPPLSPGLACFDNSDGSVLVEFVPRSSDICVAQRIAKERWKRDEDADEPNPNSDGDSPPSGDQVRYGLLCMCRSSMLKLVQALVERGIDADLAEPDDDFWFIIIDSDSLP